MKKIIRGEAGRDSKRFDLLVQSIIVISIVSLTIDTVPNHSPPVRFTLNIIEVCSLTFFTIEYLLRIYSAENKKKYLLSFWGIIDFISIAPSLFLSGVDMRAFRSLRLLRIFRILKLGRQSEALSRLITALRRVRSELVVFLFITLIFFYLSGVLIYMFEYPAQPETFASIPHSLWWSVATITTVGYGDIYPVTVGGKICTFFVLVIGLGLVAVPTGLITSALNDSASPDSNDQ